MSYKEKEAQRSYQLDWINARRDRWIATQGGCANCGFPDDLRVVHREGEERDPRLRSTSAMWSISEERLAEEIKKCEVLCRICYNERRRMRNMSYLCPKGHAMLGDDLTWDEKTSPRCLKCHRLESAAYKDKRRRVPVLEHRVVVQQPRAPKPKKKKK